MSLIQDREIIWNHIIHTMRNILEFLLIVAEENVIIRDMEGIISSSKQKIQQRANLAKKIIDFLNSKTSQELRDMQIEYITNLVLEVNKMALKNLYRKTTKTKLGEIKEVVLKLNTNFDKRTRA